MSLLNVIVLLEYFDLFYDIKILSGKNSYIFIIQNSNTYYAGIMCLIPSGTSFVKNYASIISPGLAGTLILYLLACKQ